MEELIKYSFSFYFFCAAFMGLCVLLAIYYTFKNTKNIANEKIKAVLRVGICGVLIGLWVWHFAYMNLYPISLAYYEYKHDIVEEKTGVINSIVQEVQDRVTIVIDNTEYTLVHSASRPFVVIGSDIDEGDTVKFEVGVKSKYIFDICVKSD